MNKSVEEIQIMLVSELGERLGDKHWMYPRSEYYNENFGDTSFLLAGLLGALLEFEEEWNSKRWVDDSLLIKVKLNENKLSIWGVVIWGVENMTNQWTEPFYFEIEFTKSKSNFKEYTFLFSDLEKPEIPYEQFNESRSYWDPSADRNWKYVIQKTE